MKLSKLILLIALITHCGYSIADNASKKEAEILLNTLGLEKVLQETVTRMLDLQLQQNPALAPYKQVMLQFFQKYMSYDSLKGEMITIYSEAFTAVELKDINAFYQSPTGKKTMQKMPELMTKGGQIGARRVQEHLPELQEMIKVESERIQKLQDNKI